ncbi:hypothetical protein DSL64_13845 [Dyadobacter luteus]|uniref:NadR/Ttd14 AAA domain-containing protein n=1 Tax=Dyadobacter luteus TaxID=2259619 RepID=A0A3D8YDJ6_9BACT|nr:AAA family ATPase [Dyadobacter luteus]REA60622.1 hypothetical protein DSL64_13845 [Dyadobacter luteus]
MNSIIITGGPGSGKSTLIDQLSLKGHHCVPEVSRVLIQEEVANGGSCLPWINLKCFADLVLERMVFDYNCNLQVGAASFFDRGIPDIIAYLQVGGIPVGKNFYQASENYRYHDIVFVGPPWKEIYVNDEERWQTFEESTILHNAIVSIYQKLGYNTIALPKTSVSSRCDFILSYLKSLPNS